MKLYLKLCSVQSCTLCAQLNWSNVHTVHTGPTVFTACALPLEILCCVHFGGGVAIKIISRSPDTHWGAPAQLLLSCLGQVCHARQPVSFSSAQCKESMTNFGKRRIYRKTRLTRVKMCGNIEIQIHAWTNTKN